MTYAPPSPWTDNKVDQLKSLWVSGLSARAIANILGDGITRNAVIGKARRVDMTPRDNPITHQRAAPRIIQDEERFIKLWHDPSITMSYMMTVFGCSNTTLYKTADRLEAGPRPIVINRKAMADRQMMQIQKPVPVPKVKREIVCACETLAVPGALLCYACGCGEVRYA